MAHAKLQFAMLALLAALGARADGPPAFSHQQHLGYGLECASCHDATSTPGAPVIHLETACKACHLDGPPARAALPVERKLDAEFPHRAHTAKLACVECHAGVPTDALSTAPVLTRESCISCHSDRHTGVSITACASCHGEDRRVIKPKSHGPDWRHTHGAAAAWALSDARHGQDCRQCHSQSSCTECHDKMAPQNHTGLWRMQTHGIAAQWDRDSCKTCHETSTCVRCHQITQPINHNGAWLKLHGLAAGSRVSDSCSACHQPAWCASCHATFVRP